MFVCWMSLYLLVFCYCQFQAIFSQITFFKGQFLGSLNFFENFTHKLVTRQWIAIWDRTVALIKKTSNRSIFKKLGSVFKLFYAIPPKVSNCDLTASHYFILIKIWFWENDKIYLTLAMLVHFWNLRYLWIHLCKGNQDFKLSHTLTHFPHTFANSSQTFHTLWAILGKYWPIL